MSESRGPGPANSSPGALAGPTLTQDVTDMRARNIKPGYFKNEDLAECAPLARILFAGLWCMADKAGRLEDRPRKIKAECLPFDECDVEQLLSELISHNFIVRYEVAGGRYIEIVNFRLHQKPHYKEEESTLPSRADVRPTKKQRRVKVDSTMKQPRADENASCPSDFLIADSLIPDSGLLESPPTPPGGEGMPPIPDSLDGPEFREAWGEWLEYRRERRPKVTPRSARMALKQLAEWGPAAAVAGIRHSIAQGYQGIVPAKAQPPPAAGRNGAAPGQSTLEKLRALRGEDVCKGTNTTGGPSGTPTPSG